MGLFPTNIDMPNPQKNPGQVYDSQYLLGTIPVAGSVSSTFDLGGWTNAALKLDVNGGTLLGGTVINIWGAPTAAGPFSPLYGTTGAVATTIQCGSTGTQIIGPITSIIPQRFVQFVAGGTQSVAQLLTLLVK